MKKVIFLLMLSVSIMFGQTVKVMKGELAPTTLFNPSDVISITKWSPFAADSSATATSPQLSIAQYDSLQVWFLATSVRGVPKFVGTLYGGFDGTNSISMGAFSDTTTSKTEVLVNGGTFQTKFLQTASFQLVPNIVNGSGTSNRADVIFNIYIVGHRRTR